MALWQETPGGLRLRVRVQPRGSRNRVVGVHADALRVQVTAPPVEGAANAAVVELLAEWLHVPRRSVTIVAGMSARDKVVSITAQAGVELGARLETALAELQSAKPEHSRRR